MGGMKDLGIWAVFVLLKRGSKLKITFPTKHTHTQNIQGMPAKIVSLL